MIVDIYCGDVIKRFIASHLNQVYQVCIAYRNVSTLFKLFLLSLISCMVCRGLTSELA